MDTTKKTPPNTFSLHLSVRDDEELLDVGIAYNTEDDLPEKEQIYFQDVMRGLVAQVNTGLDHLAFVGMTMRHLIEVEDDEDDIEFEAAPELMDAIKSAKILQFKKKMH